MRLPLRCWPSSEEEAVASLVLLCQEMEALHGVGQGCPPARSRELIPWCCLTPLCPRLGAKLGAAFPAPSPSLLRTGMQPLHHPLLPAPTPSPVGADFIGCGAAASVSSVWPGSHHEMGEGAGRRPPPTTVWATRKPVLTAQHHQAQCPAARQSQPLGQGGGSQARGERQKPPRVRECSSFCLHFPAKTVTKSPPQPQLCAGGAAGARVRKREVREKPSSLPSGGVRGGSGEPSPLLRGKESQTPPNPSREGSGALPPAHQLWGVFWGEWGLPVGRAPAWSAPCHPASTYPFQDDLLVFKHPIAAVHLGRGKERVRAPHASRGTGIWRIHPKTCAVTVDNLKCSCASLPWN